MDTDFYGSIAKRNLQKNSAKLIQKTCGQTKRKEGGGRTIAPLPPLNTPLMAARHDTTRACTVLDAATAITSTLTAASSAVDRCGTALERCPAGVLADVRLSHCQHCTAATSPAAAAAAIFVKR